MAGPFPSPSRNGEGARMPFIIRWQMYQRIPTLFWRGVGGGLLVRTSVSIYSMLTRYLYQKSWCIGKNFPNTPTLVITTALYTFILDASLTQYSTNGITSTTSSLKSGLPLMSVSLAGIINRFCATSRYIPSTGIRAVLPERS